MKPEIKALWLAALRSGEYTQGTEQLRTERGDGPRYCCLGVLCELHRTLTNAGKWATARNAEEGDPLAYIGPRDDTSQYNLPVVVQEWAGLVDCDPIIDTETLSRYNDGTKDLPALPFVAIADLIERNL